MLIVGIDCATVATRTGLSLAEYVDGVLTVKDCLVGRKEPSVAHQVLPWVVRAEVALLALDSPLGWPATLGETLYQHSAGTPIAISSDDLFRRRTDEVVRKSIGKNPLEVGADRIARTAVAALKVLEELGVLCNCKISLAWTDKLVSGIHSIEVYPAGTLRSYEESESRSGDVESRKRAVLQEMVKEGRLSLHAGALKGIDNEHALDSVFCAIAAMDFLEGKVIHPKADEEALARKEGWIWVKPHKPQD